MTTRPQYKDYLNQVLQVPSHPPQLPKTPPARHNPPLPQHHKTQNEDHTESTKIFVTPSTADKPEHHSILRDMKSFNRFNSARNTSIKSANNHRSSIDGR